LQQLPFDEATAEMRRLSGAKTHLSLDEYRTLFDAGEIGVGDVRAAIVEEVAELTFVEDVMIGDASLSAVDVVVRDLIDGPTTGDVAVPPTIGEVRAGPSGPAVAAAIDDIVTSWLALYVDEGTAAWSLPGRDRGFYATWRDVVEHDARVDELVSERARSWLASLPTDAVSALAAAVGALGLAGADRVEEFRRQLLRLPGYAGLARWRDDWAPSGHPAPPLRVIDIVAVRCALDAAISMSRGAPAGSEPPADVVAPSTAPTRVDAVVAALDGDDADRAGVAAILSLVPEHTRHAIWLAAHERCVRGVILDRLQRVPLEPRSARPDLQAVFCIDVRSEVMRRHLEAVGRCETVGFAGFFGVPIRWNPIGSPWTEPRCPVLVAPVHDVVEEAEQGAAAHVDRTIARQRTVQRSIDVFHDTKASATAPFALAEVGGFVAGPSAALRTLVPLHRQPGAPHGGVADATTHVVLDSMTLDERALFAEAILRTMGLTRRIGRVVLLCGHGAESTNNPHASALDCGACGGAHGGPNARVAAAILNDAEVRVRLAQNGIEVPADAHFLAGEHDTVSDTVTIFDGTSPHPDLVAELVRDLEAAGRRVAAERAARLPGDPSTVRRRGLDWAEVRPEWGLAGNAAFVIAPRSLTAAVDLGGRAFLHSYDADADVEGLALETIMTAPLVVAQWISAQYYFSTVDNDRFGAGDKVLHNPVGGVGVVTGQGGDLRVGLPAQSVSMGGRNVHDPVRLLAVVQAPLERIERIIQRNQVLRELIGGRWITVAGRSGATDEWSIRTPSGTWVSWSPSSSFVRSADDVRDDTDRVPSPWQDTVDERVEDERVEVG
jgi:hypothetical protein